VYRESTSKENDMPQLAKRNGICEQCRTPIIKGVHMLATNSFDPDPKAPWLHQDCAEEQEAAIEAKYTGKPTTKEALQLASMEKLVRQPSQQSEPAVEAIILDEYDVKPVFYTTKAVGKKLSVDPSTVIQMVRDGELKGAKVRHMWRVYADSVDAYLSRS